MIHGKSLEAWCASHPLIRDLVALRETSWFNPAIAPAASALADVGLGADDVAEASARLQRFAPYIAKVFPETAAAGGIIESGIVPLPKLQRRLREEAGKTGEAHLPAAGALWLKTDNALPISGSIKARGGIHEVLWHAEQLALQAGLIREGDDYAALASDSARAFFGRHRVAVGPTGNLGLSIGIMSAKLGFQATVHMSADARQWKKDRLRASGVTVVEHASGYSVAVEQGRREAASDPARALVPTGLPQAEGGAAGVHRHDHATLLHDVHRPHHDLPAERSDTRRRGRGVGRREVDRPRGREGRPRREQPAPEVRILELNELGVRVQVLAWVATTNVVSGKTKLMAAVKHAFDRAQLKVATPERVVRLVPPDPPQSQVTSIE